MSNELDAACARALGWINLRTAVLYTKPYLGQPPGETRHVLIPQFSTDPVAALLLEHEIERRGLHDAYIDSLLPSYHSFEPLTRAELFALLRATPEQKARAFLAALGGGGDGR